MPVILTRETINRFQQTILQYYNTHGRRFPWRETDDAYRILVSEIMLQQTQTERVAVKYREWMERFPTVQAAAESSFADILAVWNGLGYNRRARYLHETCRRIFFTNGGVFPLTPAELESLPGIGPYTARAVCTFAAGLPEVFIETNIRSVFIFFFFNRPHGYGGIVSGSCGTGLTDPGTSPEAPGTVWVRREGESSGVSSCREEPVSAGACPGYPDAYSGEVCHPKAAEVIPAGVPPDTAFTTSALWVAEPASRGCCGAGVEKNGGAARSAADTAAGSAAATGSASRSVSDRELFPLIEQTLYRENPRIWYYALMDYGAALKKVTVNPGRRSSGYVKQSRFQGSLRQARGAILRCLSRQSLPAGIPDNSGLQPGGMTLEQISALEHIEQSRLAEAASQLLKENMIQPVAGGGYILRETVDFFNL